MVSEHDTNHADNANGPFDHLKSEFVPIWTPFKQVELQLAPLMLPYTPVEVNDASVLIHLQIW